MTRQLLLASFIAVATSFGAPTTPGHFDNPLAFSRELRRLSSEAQRNGAGVGGEVPSEWQVETEQGAFRISSEPLRDRDGAGQSRWLQYLAAEAESYHAASNAIDEQSGARDQMERILRDREFVQAEAQKTWVEGWQERLSAWLRKQLDKLLRLAAQHPTTSQTLFWTALCGGVAFLAWRLFLLWNRPETAFHPSTGRAGPVPSSDAQWIAAARQAAESGDLRRAIQCAYWAGVVRLQDTGRLSKTGNQTPREYLKAVGASEVGVHLGALTTSLERFWYARTPAAEEHFAVCLGSLEAFGCKLD